MGWWFFGSQKEVEHVEEDTKRGFEAVKKDITAISGWIKYLNSEKNLQKKDIEELKEKLSTIQEETEGLKNIISFIGEIKNSKIPKQSKHMFNKQTDVYAVSTGVQTGVQTLNLDNFSVTERAILWVLLNNEMKLSYDDLAAMLGKEKATIRGQINSIKQKNRDIIEEIIEKNGKKRVFILENIKEKLLKKQKVRVEKQRKNL